MSSNEQPLLSIFIPTFNRPTELRETLRILDSEFRLLDEKLWKNFEIVVSDNASPKEADPAGIAAEYAESPLRVKLFRQQTNIGPTLNFESCFQRAQGRHVLLLSDDDHLTAGSLALIHASLERDDPDLLFLPFRPQRVSRDVADRFERNDFLVKLGHLPSLVSACVFKRALITPVFGRYLDTNMHHFFYYLTVVENGQNFYRLDREILFSPYTENQGGYNWFKAFGSDFPRIVREFPRDRISPRALSSVLDQLLKRLVVPTYLNLKIRGYLINRNFKQDNGWSQVKIIIRNFATRPAFWLFFAPILIIPAPLLRGLKRIYLWQKSFFFHWDPI